MEENTRQEQGEEKKSLTDLIPVKYLIIIGATVAAVILLASILGGLFAPKTQEPEIITVASLKEIINISELSSMKTNYNGVAEVHDEKKPEEIDYYVSYKSEIVAGIDFEAVQISADYNTKVITVKLPQVKILDYNVDITSLDYIFKDKKANTSGVSEAAYKACQADVEAETQSNEELLNLARQNAVNVVTALLKPVVEQMEDGYTLVVE